MKTVRFLSILFCICLPLSLSAAKPDKQLQSLKKIYEDGMAKKLRAGGPKSVEVAYLNDLGRLAKKRQAAGDLDGLMAMQEETARFGESGKLTAEHLVEAPAELRALQQKHMKALAAAPLKRAKAIVDWTHRYTSKLKSMQQDYTRRGSIDAALSINSEVKRVTNSDAVREAKALLAAPPAGGGAEADPADGGAAVIDDQVPAGREPVERIGGHVIYWKEKPRAGELRYKSLTLRNTARARLKRDVSVTAQIATSSSSERSVETHEASYSSSKSTEKETHLRLALRSPRGIPDQGILRLMVQCFGRQVSSERGKTDPEEIRSVTVPLRRPLGVDLVTVDVEPVKTGTRSSSYVSAWSDPGSAKNERGMDFYGVIISVFGPDGSVAYQSTSMSALEDMAKDQVPSIASLKARMAATAKELKEVYPAYVEARQRYWANEANPDVAATYRSKKAVYESAAAASEKAREAYRAAGGILAAAE